MSLRSFTVLAQSLRKKRDLDLRHARIHSIPRPRSFDFHIVALEQTLTLSTSRRGRRNRHPLISPLPPPSTIPLKENKDEDRYSPCLPRRRDNTPQTNIRAHRNRPPCSGTSNP